SGIVNESDLSKHLISRRNVESILALSSIPLTTLRAGIIVGSGSASFEIIRDLVEKLPVMIAPKWLKTKCQPIAIRNVIEFLTGVIDIRETYNKSYDIGGPDILTYKEMLLNFSKIRSLRRYIIVVPVMTPRLSSYWLYFVTSTSYTLARNLVDSMKIEVICKPNNLAALLNISLIDYATSIKLAFGKIEQNQVLSSWKDAQTSNILNKGISHYLEVPVYGCFKDIRRRKITNAEVSINKIWAIGGKTGWYYGTWLWEVRGFMDQLIGGVGMRRGRRSATDISTGDSLDFWRVLIADKEEKRLLLFAEMKLPGEAWLEFKIDKNNILTQTATFRPLGLSGRLYWYAVLPFHGFIFNGMISKLIANEK
ncbi:MAG: SDR family oxidoreductase, partial [Chitinophagaceae bacterium]